MTIDLALRVALDGAWTVAPGVALRPEPFGALAYHFGNRRLSFLRSPDIVAVVSAVGDHATVADALGACGIAPTRWPSFQKALATLVASEVLVESHAH